MMLESPAAPPAGDEATYDPKAYWSARLAAEAGPEGSGWQGLGRAFNVWLYRARRRVLRRVAAEYAFAARPPRVLEIGPGNGFSVREWARLGVRELVGLEIAPAAVARLRRRFPAYEFVEGDVGAGGWAVGGGQWGRDAVPDLAPTSGMGALTPGPSPQSGRAVHSATELGGARRKGNWTPGRHSPATESPPLPDSGEGKGVRAQSHGDAHLGTCDVVTAFDVLFHLTDDAAWERALVGMAAAARPGGLVLITDLFPHGGEVRRAHQVSRTAARYEAMLVALGLREEGRWPVFVLMHPAVDVRARWVRAAGRLWWAAVERLAGHVPGAGGPLGALLYAADALLTRLVRGGPSMELWVLRRAG